MQRLWYSWLLGLSAALAMTLCVVAGVIIVGLPVFVLSLLIVVPDWAVDAAAIAGAAFCAPYLFARHYLLAPDVTQQLRDSIPSRNVVG